ncbi:MAG: UDP-N-acetylmuramoyl-L-alanyl-D-glutamate--2,6-diaminopimelate ligase [Dehalococcoidia bacterium]
MSPRGDWREGLPPDVDRGDLPPVEAIRHDSREVAPGDAFVCIEGLRFDGHEYAAAAVEAGASVLVAATGRGEALRAAHPTVNVIEVPSPRGSLAALAAAHEGYPARSLTVVGITGTDGKSTTSFMTHAALEGAGVRTGLLTTIGTRIGFLEAAPNATRLTTQEAPTVQRMLAEMVEAGCTHAVVEATSHGLDLHRLDGCEFDIAVLTNLTPDHLDYHGTFEAYRAAKARLFSMLDEPTTKRTRRVAVINRDDPSWQHFARATRKPLLTYAIEDTDADMVAADVLGWSDGSTFALRTDEWEIDASVPLPGAFNVLNATAAIAVAAALRLDPVAAAAGVASMRGVPGRMERVRGAPFPVIVDYAHTAEALRQVLEELRPLVEGRLIVVFGCAGERSKERRSGLGAVAAELADLAILTEEDPRSEPSEAIIEEIAAAMRAAGATEGAPAGSGPRFERVPDRRDAIARALDLAAPGDLVLLAGKGHESTIERAEGPIPWNEHATAATLIEARFGP